VTPLPIARQPCARSCTPSRPTRTDFASRSSASKRTGTTWSADWPITWAVRTDASPCANCPRLARTNTEDSVSTIRQRSLTIQCVQQSGPRGATLGAKSGLREGPPSRVTNDLNHRIDNRGQKAQRDHDLDQRNSPPLPHGHPPLHLPATIVIERMLKFKPSSVRTNASGLATTPALRPGDRSEFYASKIGSYFRCHNDHNDERGNEH
jgi:hypothetical protein